MTKIMKRLKLYHLNRNRKSNCLILCSVTEKIHDDQGYSYKIKRLRPAYGFRGLVHYHDGREHENT